MKRKNTFRWIEQRERCASQIKNEHKRGGRNRKDVRTFGFYTAIFDNSAAILAPMVSSRLFFATFIKRKYFEHFQPAMCGGRQPSRQKKKR